MVTGFRRGSRTSRGSICERMRCACSATRLARGTSRGIPLRAARDLEPGETLDLVAGADVVVLHDADAALGAGAHFAHVVLEAPQRVELALVDDHVVAQHAHGVAALDEALRDEAAGYRAALARAEHLAHLGEADDLLLDLRLQHSRDPAAHVV